MADACSTKGFAYPIKSKQAVVQASNITNSTVLAEEFFQVFLLNARGHVVDLHLCGNPCDHPALTLGACFVRLLASVLGSGRVHLLHIVWNEVCHGNGTQGFMP